jgi:hypothetical protein
MRYFKITCLAVSGASNKVFNSGDIKAEDQFLPGAADAYVKSGHIVLYEGPIPEEGDRNAAAPSAITAPAAPVKTDPPPAPDPVKVAEENLEAAKKTGDQAIINKAKGALTKAKNAAKKAADEKKK